MKNQLISTNNSIRIAWIDYIRLFAILLVILGHCWYLGDPNALGGYEVAGYHLQKLLIVSFNMPLFVFLSGFCAYKGLVSINSFDSLIAYWRKISMRIAIPTFLMFVLEVAISRFGKNDFIIASFCIGILIVVTFTYYYSKHSRRMFFQKAFSVLTLLILFITAVHSSFWFPTMLLQIMLFFSIVVHLNGIHKPVLSFLFATGGLIIIFLLSSKLPYTEEFCIYFAFGLCLKHFYLFQRTKRPHLLSIFFLFAAILLMFVVGDNDFYTFRFSDMMNLGSGYCYFILRQLCAISWIVFFCCIFKGLFNFNKCQIISYLGGATLPLYLIHALIKSYTFQFIHITSRNDLIIWALIFLVFIALFCASTLVIFLFRKNEITKVLFLGEKA